MGAAQPEPADPAPAHDLAAALGGDTIDALSRQTGMSRDDLLHRVLFHLPVPERTSPRARYCPGT